MSECKQEQECKHEDGTPEGDSKVLASLCAYFETAPLVQLLAGQQFVCCSLLPRLLIIESKVIGMRNLGDHLMMIFPEADQMQQAASKRQVTHLPRLI